MRCIEKTLLPGLSEILGGVVRRRREELGLTIDHVCARAGVSTTRWLQIESGKAQPTAAQLVDISRALDVRPRYVFERVAERLEPRRPDVATAPTRMSAGRHE